MASPQLENGYIKIANEIFDALIGTVTIPSEVRRIADFVLRKTYGFNKKEDLISLSQLALATRLKRPSVIRAIKKAIFMNIISRTANKNGWKYRFNKDFDTWKPLAPRLIVSPTANASLAPRLHTKDTSTKNNIPFGKIPKGATTPPMNDEYTLEPDPDTLPVRRKRAKEDKAGPLSFSNFRKIYDFFYKAYKNEHGNEPEAMNRADYQNYLKARKEYNLSADNVQSLISWFVTSKKAEKFASLATAFSRNSIFLWKKEERKS